MLKNSAKTQQHWNCSFVWNHHQRRHFVSAVRLLHLSNVYCFDVFLAAYCLFHIPRPCLTVVCSVATRIGSKCQVLICMWICIRIQKSQKCIDLYLHLIFDLHLKVFANTTKYTYMFDKQNAKHCLTKSDWLKSKDGLLFHTSSRINVRQPALRKLAYSRSNISINEWMNRKPVRLSITIQVRFD